MQHPLLQKFSLISEVLLTNQSGFPFCELILNRPIRMVLATCTAFCKLPVFLYD
jgi:hypothetical protein